MFLEFRLQNFKSFREPAVFSMIPAPKQKDLAYSIIERKVKGIRKTQKALCSSVIYGPNASGKSNIICAVDLLRSIVLRGNILDDSTVRLANDSSSFLSLIPNSFEPVPLPVGLGITFLIDSLKVDYEIQIDLGQFLDKSYKRKVIFEQLKLNEKKVFERKEDKVSVFKTSLDKQGESSSSEDSDLIGRLLNNGLNEEELFLSNGFKNILNPSLASRILTWFREGLRILYHSESLRIVGGVENEAQQEVLELLTSAAEAIGSKSSSFTFGPDSTEKGRQILYSVLENSSGTQKKLSSEIYESYGTVRFMHLFPLVFDALVNGTVLFIDEFDASIHPIAIMDLINIFHNEDINRRGAQLIFNTHNPIFLSANLFRRDEIKFVDKEGNTSIIYSLSDFGTSGEGAVRRSDDYMKNYFVDRYGAISETNFSDLFLKFMNNKNEA